MAAPIPRRAARRTSGASLAGGFALGLVATAAGLLLAGGGGQGAPPGTAAEHAARTAATRLTLAATSLPVSAPPAEASSLARALPAAFGEAASFSPQRATRIVIPSVGIDAPVRPVGYVYREGRLAYDVPRLDAGEYVTGTPVGQPGNAVIGGHIVRRGGDGVFRGLPEIAPGDLIEVYRGDELFRYSVMEIRVVAPDATSVMSQTHEATLTLITCFPDDSYQDRLVVVGRLL
ncbi:MAG: sortase [Dehalococcoidia bacterium]